VVEELTKVASKVIGAISSPVLIFLIVLNVTVLGGTIYLWTHQRAEAIEAYAHLVNMCLPSREKL